LRSPIDEQTLLGNDPAEIEAWNAKEGLTEGDDDYRYPECGMTSDEIHVATGGEDSSDDNRNGFTELKADEWSFVVGRWG
jgi:hypothetical protein